MVLDIELQKSGDSNIRLDIIDHGSLLSCWPMQACSVSDVDVVDQSTYESMHALTHSFRRKSVKMPPERAQQDHIIIHAWLRMCTAGEHVHANRMSCT